MKKTKEDKESGLRSYSERTNFLINATKFFLSRPKGNLDNVRKFFYANNLRGGGIVTLTPDQGGVRFEIWPGSMIIVDYGDIWHHIVSPDDPKQYIRCPKCGEYWRKRTEQPKQCPTCHRVLTKYTLEDLTLEVPDWGMALHVIVEKQTIKGYRLKEGKVIVKREKVKQETVGGIFQL